jgi:hypothetical protein
LEARDGALVRGFVGYAFSHGLSLGESLASAIIDLAIDRDSGTRSGGEIG